MQRGGSGGATHRKLNSSLPACMRMPARPPAACSPSQLSSAPQQGQRAPAGCDVDGRRPLPGQELVHKGHAGDVDRLRCTAAAAGDDTAVTAGQPRWRLPAAFCSTPAPLPHAAWRYTCGNLHPSISTSTAAVRPPPTAPTSTHPPTHQEAQLALDRPPLKAHAEQVEQDGGGKGDHGPHVDSVGHLSKEQWRHTVDQRERRRSGRRGMRPCNVHAPLPALVRRRADGKRAALCDAAQHPGRCLAGFPTALPACPVR